MRRHMTAAFKSVQPPRLTILTSIDDTVFMLRAPNTAFGCGTRRASMHSKHALLAKLPFLDVKNKERERHT